MATLPTAIVAGDPGHVSHHDALHALYNLGAVKGQLVIPTAAQVWAALNVGTDTHVLTADSTQPTGVKWAAPSSGGITELPIPHGGLGLVIGTPVIESALTTNGRISGWLLDAASTEQVGASLVVPTGWTTLAIDVWLTNAAAGAGNVVVDVNFQSFATAADISPAGTDDQQTTAAPASNFVKKVTFHAAGVACTAGALGRVLVARFGADGADTLANDLGLVSVLLRKVS